MPMKFPDLKSPINTEIFDDMEPINQELLDFLKEQEKKKDAEAKIRYNETMSLNVKIYYVSLASLLISVLALLTSLLL